MINYSLTDGTLYRVMDAAANDCDWVMLAVCRRALECSFDSRERRELSRIVRESPVAAKVLARMEAKAS
jgi:hypothetical protein